MKALQNRVHLSSRTMFLLLLTAFGTTAQTAALSEDFGYAEVNQEHVQWPSPESVLRDLSSPNDETRLNALKLAGVGDRQTHTAVWSQSHVPPAKIIGEAVITPDRTQLSYAALGGDATQQAIVAFEVSSLSSTFMAVAVRRGQRWERVAALSCWCKYDRDPDQDALAEFVSLHPAPEALPAKQQHYELVVRSSGGGTGIYTQYEAHFRFYHNELRRVLQFVSGYRSSDPTAKPPWLILEKRWFTIAPVGTSAFGGTLVEAKGTFPADKYPQIQWSVKPLMDMHLQEIHCRNYKWNQQTFRYEPLDEAVTACEVHSN